MKTPAETGKVTVIPATPLTPATPATSGTVPGYKEVARINCRANAIQMGAGKLVLVIGSDAFNMTNMTANAGGALGKSSGKPVIFSFLSPDQPYEQMETAETYTVRFYPQTKPNRQLFWNVRRCLHRLRWKVSHACMWVKF